MAKAKEPKMLIKHERVAGVQIEAVKNGYRLIVGSGIKNAAEDSTKYILVSGGDSAYWSAPNVTKKPAQVAQIVRASGEYVFPNFAALSAWLRKQLIHGAG